VDPHTGALLVALLGSPVGPRVLNPTVLFYNAARWRLQWGASPVTVNTVGAQRT
jgi:hypothetical protein